MLPLFEKLQNLYRNNPKNGSCIDGSYINQNEQGNSLIRGEMANLPEFAAIIQYQGKLTCEELVMQADDWGQINKKRTRVPLTKE